MAFINDAVVYDTLAAIKALPATALVDKMFYGVLDADGSGTPAWYFYKSGDSTAIDEPLVAQPDLGDVGRFVATGLGGPGGSSGGGGGGGSRLLSWTFDNTANNGTGLAPGNLRVDVSPTLNGLSEIYIHTTDASGNDWGQVLGSLLSHSDQASTSDSIITFVIQGTAYNCVLDDWSVSGSVYTLVVEPQSSAIASVTPTNGETIVLGLAEYYAQRTIGARKTVVGISNGVPGSIASGQAHIGLNGYGGGVEAIAVSTASGSWLSTIPDMEYFANEFFLGIEFEKADYGVIAEVTEVYSITGGKVFLLGGQSEVYSDTGIFQPSTLWTGAKIRVALFSTSPNTGGGGGGGTDRSTSITTGNTETLGVDKVLADGDGKHQMFNGGVADRNVDLYNGGAEFREHVIWNNGTTNNITVRSVGGAAVLDTIPPGGVSAVVYEPTFNVWRLF